MPSFDTSSDVSHSFKILVSHLCWLTYIPFGGVDLQNKII